ncbi:zinc finger and BTB domain-containing protein 18 isoform X2 [Cryptotermes secundus]|uniref:zinc finger and BTB domain-containing protein 18 isoform X2 n=1 Tax=Cryptotermes secundus TaxID=105785 RepID=UPI000CD7ACE7|nr:zinc finger and BTB domain-containing protein 18 isoform X2 [Cryptotermes secundus]
MDDFDFYLKRCRLCACEHRLGINIFGSEGTMLDLMSKIKMYLSINVCSEDALPNHVCYQCLYRVETFHSFKLSCIESEHTLRNWHFFYGGIADEHDTSDTEDELESANETEKKIVTSTSPELKSSSSESTQHSPSVSVDSVAQPTTSSFSTLKLAKMAETAMKSKETKGLQLQNEVGGKTAVDSPFIAKVPSQKKQPTDPNGKVDIVAVKSGRNIMKISNTDQNMDTKDQPSSNDNNEVSRILLNMSGVGTISVTKYEGIGLKKMDMKDNSKIDGGTQENQHFVMHKQQTQEYVIVSDDDDDDDDESDGFSGFDFEETPTVAETGECTKEKPGAGLQETVVVGELVPNECIRFEHLEFDKNGTIHNAENESQKTEKLEFQDAIKYTAVNVDTRFACIRCNKTFAQKSYIKEHMKIHTGEKPYSCKVCGRSFRNNYMLKVHMRLHTGEKNFKCEECGALFTERGALVCHARTHTGVKPFVCIFCDRKFAQNPALKRHLRIHTKYHLTRFVDPAVFTRNDGHVGGYALHVQTSGLPFTPSVAQRD